MRSVFRTTRQGICLSLSAAALALAAPAGFADSIDPATFSATLGVGDSVTINKTVTIDEVAGGDAPVDVLFFADTTGSMSGALSSVRSSIADIITNTSGLGDVWYGAAEYKDIFDSSPVNPYELRQDLTGTTADVISAVNTHYTATGGGDTPEGQIPALKEAAETTSWRTGSTRILVWFGDALGHDPRDGVSESDAIAALQAESIEVQSIGITSGANNFNSTGQATRITNATGGAHRDGIDSAAIVSEITDAITTAVTTYSTVDLELSEVPAGVTVTNNTGAITGSFDRSVTRTFDFDVTFTGDSTGVYDFPIYATVDGGRVAREDDRITVGAATVPEPGSLALASLGLLMLGASRRRS